MQHFKFQFVQMKVLPLKKTCSTLTEQQPLWPQGAIKKTKT